MTTQAPGTQQPAATPAAPPAKPSTALARPPDDGAALNAFASIANFEAAQRMGKMLCRSSLVPKAYQGEENLGNCIIALELAARIGASVFMVMQNLHIIQGRPGWAAQFLIASVNASGRFTPLRFRAEGKIGEDSYGVRAVAKDIKSGEELEGTLITWEMVKGEGWLGKPGSKWRTMPAQMFLYRAGSFWTRTYAPEIGLGLQTAEELHDTIDTVGSSVPDDGPALPAEGAAQIEDALRGLGSNGTPAPSVPLNFHVTMPPATTGQAIAQGATHPPLTPSASESPQATAGAPPAPAATPDATPPAARRGRPPKAQGAPAPASPAEPAAAGTICWVCGKVCGADAVASQGPKGPGHRHPDCAPFGAAAEPADPEPPADVKTETFDDDLGGRE